MKAKKRGYELDIYSHSKGGILCTISSERISLVCNVKK